MATPNGKEMNEDIFLKMSNEPVKAVLAEKEKELINEGVFARTDPRQWLEVMPFGNFESFPKAFIEDQTGTWVSLYEIQGFHSCNRTITAIAPFPNCVLLEGSQLNIEKGIYFIYAPPLASIPISLKEAKALFKDPKKIRERINDALQDKKGQKLLIIYDSYDEMIKIYENFIKAEELRFPLAFVIEEPGEFLFILNVPRLSERIPYEIIKNMDVYNYKITFSEKVARFRIFSKNGHAELIFNQNDERARATISYRQCEDYLFYLEPHKLYLFSETQPNWAWEEEEEELKWIESLHAKKR